MIACPHCDSYDSLEPIYHEVTRERYPDLMWCLACGEEVVVDGDGVPLDPQPEE